MGVDLCWGTRDDVYSLALAFLIERITYTIGRLDDIYALVFDFWIRRTTNFVRTLALPTLLAMSALQDLAYFLN
jgi:hypothetical protein